MSLVGNGVECGIYIIHDFRESQFEKSVLIVRKEIGHHRLVAEIFRSLASSCLFAKVAVRHHDNHWFALALCNEVVHDA